MSANVQFLVPAYEHMPFLGACGLQSLVDMYSKGLNASSAVPNCRPMSYGLSIDMMFQIILYLSDTNLNSEQVTPFVLYSNSSTTFTKYLDTVAATDGVCALSYLYKTHERDQILKASIPVCHDDRTAVYVEDLKRELEMWNLGDVFRVRLWAALAFYYFMVRLLQYAAKKLSNYIVVKDSKLAWLGLSTALFIALYRGGLLSQLLVSKEPEWFHDVDSLAREIKKGNAKVLIYEGPFGQPALQLIETTPELREAAKYSEDTIIFIKHDSSSLLAHLNAHKRQAVALYNEFQMLRLASQNAQVRVVVLQDVESVQLVVYCNQKTSEWAMARINNAIYSVKDQIIASQTRYTKAARQEYDRSRRVTFKRRLRPINLSDYISNLVLLAIGTATAVLVLVFELVYLCSLK